MVIIAYVVFLSVFILDHLGKHDMVPRQVSWVPELLSGLAIVMVVLYGALEKRLMITGKYVLLFGVMALFLSSSLIINDVQPGTVFIGLRSYLKFIPFFFLPVVFEYSERQLRNFFIFFMLLGILQLPVAVAQKIIYAKWLSGDFITGTLVRSGTLSHILVSFQAFLVSLYSRQKITTAQFLVLLFIFFVPTTINETKITLIILPIAIGLPIFFMPNKEQMLKKMAPLVAIGGVLIIIYAGVYQQFYSSRGDMREGNIIEFMTDPDRLEHYLVGNVAERGEIGSIDRVPTVMAATEVSEDDRVSRFDSIWVAWKVLSGDVLRSLVGVGIGNVTDSYLGKLFSGKYSYYFLQFGAGSSTLSIVLWELGFIGLGFSIVFFIFLFQDAKKLSKEKDLFGVLGQAWIPVVCIMVITFPYYNTLAFNAISYFFWFFSGQVVAARARQIWRGG